MSFILKTAWRDARHQPNRLLLCALSIVFGVAAMVAVDSFAANLTKAMDAQAKTLLGADLEITSRAGFDERAELIIDGIGGTQARETRFASMAYFPKADQARLVQVRALGGGFPFYGEFETEPAGMNPALADAPVIVLDPLLLAQYGLSAGDTVTLGAVDFTITASLQRVPGEAAFAGLFAPRAYIPLSQLEATGLIGTGSIAFHRVYFSDLPRPAEQIAEEYADRFARARLSVDTVQAQRDKVGQPLENLTRFLSLVGFVALLLGGVGIAGAVRAYLEKKRDTVAILRCLGSDARVAFSVFLVQVAGIALVGAVAGAAFGVLCQSVLPKLLAPLLPFELNFFAHPPSIMTGAGYGFVTAFIFGLFPLLPLRRVSPLQAIRAGFESGRKRRDPLAVALAGLAAVALAAFCMSRTAVWWHGLVFAAGLGFVTSVLWLIAVLMKWVLRRFFKPSNFLLRQASGNLHRPNNRTVFLGVSLGVGTFLIFTLILIQAGLLQQTDIAARSNDPNILFFDVQQDQYEGLETILNGKGIAIMEAAPIVTMRLSAVKGRTLSDIKSDPKNTIDEWILNREWRSSYRGALGPAERLVAGDYVARWDSFEEPVPISMEADMAKDLGVELGDTLVFDIQGIPMEVAVSSLRKVDWAELRPNFFATFPLGVLEAAPQWWIAVGRSPDVATTAALQTELFQAYPNISAVDLNVVINALQGIFGRINFAIRFMGLFTAITGVIILANAVTTSRNQRVRESVLLRTIGASGGQIRMILALEYALIGFVSAVIGVGLALAASTALGVWVFKVDFYIPVVAVGAAVVFVSGLAVVTGMLSSRGIANHPPLAILRREG